jgi:uncharacterized membrane protein
VIIKPSLLDINRVNALTDATFGVAMTILILSIEMPQGFTKEVMHYYFYNRVLPSLLIYSLSFVILGSFWNESHHHNHLVYKSDVLSIWLYIFFLMFICIIPFSSHFVLHYPKDRTSVLFYLFNLLIAKSINLYLFYYTWRKKFLRPEVSILHCKSVLFRNSIPAIFYFSFIPVAYFYSSWVLYLFPLPLILQIVIGALDSVYPLAKMEASK